MGAAAGRKRQQQGQHAALYDAEAGKGQEPGLDPCQDIAGKSDEAVRQVRVRNVQSAQVPDPCDVGVLLHQAHSPWRAITILSPRNGQAATVPRRATLIRQGRPHTLGGGRRQEAFACEVREGKGRHPRRGGPTNAPPLSVPSMLLTFRTVCRLCRSPKNWESRMAQHAKSAAFLLV